MLHTPPTRREWQDIAPAYGVVDAVQNDESDSEQEQDQEHEHEHEHEELSLAKSVSDQSLATTQHKEQEQMVDAADDDRAVSTLLNHDGLLIEAYSQPSAADLPTGLLSAYEGYLKELKEPKFERALAVFEISDMFQGFYQRFQRRVLGFIDSERQMELAELDSERHSVYYKYNLLIERLLCETFYSSITKPTRGLQIDEFEREVNDQFGLKLQTLNKLNIHFSNLDIDLPSSIEHEFIGQIGDKILPEFELMLTEQSPTLKMKYLMKIHSILSDIISDLTNGASVLNTDIFLPVMIFCVIKLGDLYLHSLVTQLLMVKRFSNEYIFKLDDDRLQDERGRLLYVMANFEACISYISSVTLENLGIDPENYSVTIDDVMILNSNVGLDSIDEEVEDFKSRNPQFSSSQPHRRSVPANSWVSLPTPTLNTDQGLKNISNAVDSSIKNIIGRVSWLSSNSGSSEEIGKPELGGTLSSTMLQQLEENAAFMGPKSVQGGIVSPMNSLSSAEQQQRGTETETATPFPVSGKYDTVIATGGEAEPRPHRSSTQERLTSRLGGVLKSFRLQQSPSQQQQPPPQAQQQQQQQSQPMSPVGMSHSRTASFISASFFGSPSADSRSRGNSIPTRLAGTLPPSGQPETDALDLSKLPRFPSDFDSLSMGQMKQLFDAYQSIMSKFDTTLS